MFQRILALAVLLCAAASAQMTTITSTIRTSIGASLFNGRVVIEAPAMRYNGTDYARQTKTVTVSSGSFSTQLLANSTADPVGTTYRVTYYPNGEPGWSETWEVPYSAGALTIADVRIARVNPPNVASLPLSQIAPSGATNGQGLLFNGTRWAPGDLVPPAWSSITGKPSTFTPSAHASAHAPGGSDSLSLGIYDVKAYGAVGDGVANDTTPIQNAIAALGSSGKILTFYSNTYNATGEIDFTAKSNYTVMNNRLPVAGSYTGSGRVIGQSSGIVPNLWADYTDVSGQRSFALLGQVHASQSGGHDVAGVVGAAEALSGADKPVFGGNFLAQINTGATPNSVIGAEFNTNNNLRAITSEADALNVVGVQSINGGIYNGKWAFAVAKGIGSQPWIGGIKFVSGGVSDYGIDMKEMSNTIYPIRFNSGAGLRWVNNADTAFYDVLQMNSDDNTVVNASVVTEARSMGIRAAIASGRTFDIINSSASPLFSVDSSGNASLIGTLGLPAYTVATLPAAPSTGAVAVVTDAATAGNCTTGSGSEIALCRWNGSAWATLGGGGGGTLTEINAGTGISVTTSGTERTVAVDTTTTPQFVTDTADASGNCSAGAIWLRTDTADTWDCTATNTWTRRQKYNADLVTTGTTLTADAPLIGNGSKAVAVGSRSGNRTEFATVNGTKTPAKQLAFDADGNVVASAYDVGAAGGGGAITQATYAGTINFPAIADGACAESTFAASGLVAGTGLTLVTELASGLVSEAWTDATDTAGVRVCNFTGATVDLASGTFTVAGNGVEVIKQDTAPATCTAGVGLWQDTNDSGRLYRCSATDTWTEVAGSGTGDVAGPASSTDNAITRFHETGGKTIQNSLATVDDNGSINIPTGQAYKINGNALTAADVGAVATGGNAGTATALAANGGNCSGQVALGVDASGACEGTATPTLGTAGSVVGSVAFANATSGTVTIQPATGALGSSVLTLPATTGTVVTTAGAAFTGAASVTGSADAVQLNVKGNGTQTSPIFRVQKSDNTVLLQVNNDGSVQLGNGTGGTTITEEVAPGTPSSGTGVLYADSTASNLSYKNDAGTVSVAVVPVTCTNQFARSLAATGVITCDSIAAADLPAVAVQTGQANTYTTGAQDFGSAASLKVPTSAGAAPTASGLVAYDSTANAYKVGVNSATKTVMMTDTVATTAQLPTAAKKRSFGATFDGGGSALTARTSPPQTIPFACTISAWNIMADTGTATVKVWKVATGTAIPTVSNSINTSGVSLSSGTAVRSTTLTDFTSTAVSANDIFRIDLTTVATATMVTVNVECDQ